MELQADQVNVSGILAASGSAYQQIEYMISLYWLDLGFKSSVTELARSCCTNENIIFQCYT